MYPESFFDFIFTAQIDCAVSPYFCCIKCEVVNS